MFEENLQSQHRTGIRLIVFASVLWGTVGIATQAVYQQSEISAFTVGFFRLALALPVIGLLCWKLVGREMFQVSRRLTLRMAAIGVMLALYQVCYFSSISFVGVAIATLVTLCSAPAIVALLSVVVLRERLTRQTLLALVLALGGTGLLVGMPVGQTAPGEMIVGTLLALGSATGYAIVTLVGRTLAGEVHPVYSTTISFASGALCLLPLALSSGMTLELSPVSWGLLGYIGLVPTAMAYFCFFSGMRYVKASIASVITMLEPLTATILAWILFDERLGLAGLAGALLLFAAIAVLYRGKDS